MAFDIGDFLFGSDEGAKSQRALEKFGISGGGELGESLEGGIRTDALLAGTSARQASGQRLARAGLTGSGIAQDVQENADLVQAEALRRARFGLISQRIRALMGVSQTPQQEGLVSSGVKAFATGFGAAKGGGF